MRTTSFFFIFFIFFGSAGIFAQFTFNKNSGYCKINLGSSVNTAALESNAVISPDGKTLYFSRDISIDYSMENYDVFFSTLLDDGSWSVAEPFDFINNDQYNAVLDISPDGKTLFIEGMYGDSLNGEEGVSVIRKEGSGWSAPVLLEFESNLLNWDSFSISMNSSETAMVVCLEQDLYVSFKKSESGVWSLPVLIEELNTMEYEYTPYLAPDDKTIYFASNREGSLSGDCDIWMAERKDDTYFSWSTPVNLGKSVNSEAWESYICISSDGKTIFFGSWDMSYGMMDIYAVPMQ